MLNETVATLTASTNNGAIHTPSTALTANSESKQITLTETADSIGIEEGN